MPFAVKITSTAALKARNATSKRGDVMKSLPFWIAGNGNFCLTEG
jgi:hypothetical protein